MKNKLIILLGFVLLTSWASSAQIYKLKQGTLKWTGRAAFSTYSLSGTLDPLSGALEVTDGKIKSGEVTVDMKSLDAENKDLKRHLRSADFFEVSKFKTAKLELNGDIQLREEIEVAGVLSIKDESNEVLIPISIIKEGDDWIVFGLVTFDRTEYGIDYNSPSFFENLKNQAIADDFDLEFRFVFEK